MCTRIKGEPMTSLSVRLAATAAGLFLAGAALAAGPTKVDAKKFHTTKDGLKWATIKPGKGAVAKNGQTVTVHYTGWLTNGTKFDSSLDRGQPFDFALGAHQVIRGWDEGVAGMKEGEKRQLVIPPALGYGPGG